MDGAPVKSCTTLAAMCEGHEIRTVESLEVDGQLDPVQQGFHERHALQCGFCTPGMLMTARALLDENPDPDRRTRSGRRSRAPSAAAPATRTSSAPCAGPPSTKPLRNRRRLSMATTREPPERDDRAPDRLRPAEAQGGRALHPRQGHVPRRHPAARDGPRRDAAQPVRARAHRLDRHLEGARAPERRRGRHRQGPRDARPRVDADDLLRHAGRARGRQGPLPGPGGRVRDRDRRVLGERRAAADRRRVRAAAGGRQRAQGARPRRAADPRRQGRPARQPREPDLGGRRRGGDRPRLRRGRHGRRARHHLSALPSGAARDVRDDRRLQPGDRPARHLQRQPGAARAPHRLRARRRPRGAHDPDPLLGHRRRLRQQGAGLPGLRVRDRRLDRRRRARSSGSRTAPRT